MDFFGFADNHRVLNNEVVRERLGLLQGAESNPCFAVASASNRLVYSSQL